MSNRRVTLTFDNGPRPGVTDAVLATLADRGVRSTFFVIGRDAELPSARAVLERAVAEGHWIGNHTMTHSVLFGEASDPELPEREVGAAQRVLGDLAHADRLFRPWGDGKLGRHLLSPGLVRYLEAGGYTCVLWNSVPRDWEHPDTWVANCLEDVLANEWSVVVLHDTEERAMRQLGALFDQLDEAGVSVVQDFPDSCIPIRRGVVQQELAGLMTAAKGG